MVGSARPARPSCTRDRINNKRRTKPLSPMPAGSSAPAQSWPCWGKHDGRTPHATEGRLHDRDFDRGAGPVGLTLAIDLAWRGIKVLVVEPRAPGEPPSVKCNHVGARTMEIFRRLGVVQAVRAAGLPDDYPNDVAFRTTTTGLELSRIPIPCRRDRYTATGGPDTWWPTPEPAHRINQIYLEPVLFAHAAAQPNIRIVNRTRLVHSSRMPQVSRRRLRTWQPASSVLSARPTCSVATAPTRQCGAASVRR